VTAIGSRRRLADGAILVETTKSQMADGFLELENKFRTERLVQEQLRKQTES
jgi:hypothetical protein